MKQMNHKDKTDRFKGGGLRTSVAARWRLRSRAKEFDRIELAAKIFAPPPIKFKDLDAFVSEHKLLTGPPFPFDVRTDFVKVTDRHGSGADHHPDRNRDITFVTKDGVSKGVVNILGKVTTITAQDRADLRGHGRGGSALRAAGEDARPQTLYWKALPLLPGLYRLDIAIKDVNNPDHIGIYGRGIEVPTYQDEKLGASSLILADEMYTGLFAPDRQRQLHYQQHFRPAAGDARTRHAGELQAQPGPELLDAVLQSWHRRGYQE